MELYKRLYHLMFNAVTDALESLESQNYGQARTILRSVQQEVEERFLEEEAEGEESGMEGEAQEAEAREEAGAPLSPKAPSAAPAAPCP